ncbi:MAG: putative nucleotidyltransferase substrate binding domain-containing protein [Burkholderiales bacterium]
MHRSHALPGSPRASRVGALEEVEYGAGIESFVEGPLASVAARAPVACGPETSIREVLETMRRERVGSMVVVDDASRPIGIFTFRDMLEKVTLPQADLSLPVSAVMTTQLFTLPWDAAVLDAVLLMAREGIRHVPLVADGKLAGFVSESRLLAVTRGGIRETRTEIRAAESVADVRRAVGAMRALVERQLRQGMSPDAITRLVTTFNDVVIQKLIVLLDTEGHFPAAHACWIVFGSEGRGEQTLATDQDNGIVIADAAAAADPLLKQRLVELAGRTNAALDECGYPLCRGKVMAGNPEWCASATEWRERFADWIDHGHPQSLLNAAIFFDFRAVHGEPTPVEALRRWLAEYARRHARFLLQMTNNALENQPPLGLVRDFSLASGGEHPNTLDLKVNGVQPFVEAARIYALASGTTATNTIERFRGAARARRISRTEVEGWVEAFRFIQGLRLKLNLEQSASGAALHNHVDPKTLNELERRILKESLRQARKLQTRLARDFGANASAFGV